MLEEVIAAQKHIKVLKDFVVYVCVYVSLRRLLRLFPMQLWHVCMWDLCAHSF
jgi:hypothetical protein